MTGKTGPPNVSGVKGITRRGMIGGMVAGMVVPAAISKAWGMDSAATVAVGGVPAGPLPRTYHTATALPGGTVLVAGGYYTGALTGAQLFDPATGSWKTVAPMRIARYNHAAACLPDGRVLVCGGVTGSGMVLASAEIYDPAADTWSPAPPLSAPRAGHDAVPLAGGVLVVGGYNLGPLSSCEVFNGSNWKAG